MENDEQHYESEANEDWVCSGMISFKMSFVGRERKSLKVYIIVISISFSYSKCVLEGDRAEADENLSYVWMRQTMRGRRVWDVLWGAGPPPTECDFEGTHSNISAMGPEFLVTAQRAIPVSGPSVYHLVFTPYSSFFTVTDWRVFSSWRWKVFNRLLTNNHSSPGHRWCQQCPMSGLDMPYQKNVSKIFS